MNSRKDYGTYRSKKDNPWMQTYSGKAFDLIDPSPDDIDFNDIARALSLINRFNGHTIFPVSVGYHSLMMDVNASEEAAPYVILHDAHEAYIGDWSSPIKDAIGNLISQEARDALGKMERKIDECIHKAAGLKWPIPARIRREIKELDRKALMSEKRAAMHKGERPWNFPDEYLSNKTYIPQDYRNVEVNLLYKFKEYGFIDG